MMENLKRAIIRIAEAIDVLADRTLNEDWNIMDEVREILEEEEWR